MHTIRTKEYWLIEKDEPRVSRRKLAALVYHGDALRTRRILHRFTAS
jgi:hypothetical protein